MLIYQEDLEGVAASDLQGFFEGWPQHPDENGLLRILRGSAAVVLALDEPPGDSGPRSSGPRSSAPSSSGPRSSRPVVGFVTAISDGELAAYIPLLEVLPAYRRRGIGRELLRRMAARLSGLYMVDLVCDPHLRRFYEPLGFQPAGAMVMRNRCAQAGRRPV